MESENTAVAFGTLERVSARVGWPHEAHQFTPWLAENVGLLGEALGLSLALTAREHKVGRYSLDLLMSDAADRTVIVENQFGQTDHDHLGKLLTYCAGTEADVVIWIAERLNEEHVAVLEWLNENTIAGVGFFGVELELLRIGASPLAPNFRVLVQPNQWTKSVRPAATSSVEWDWSKYREQLKVTEDRLAIGRAVADQLEIEIAARGVPWTIQQGLPRNAQTRRLPRRDRRRLLEIRTPLCRPPSGRARPARAARSVSATSVLVG